MTNSIDNHEQQHLTKEQRQGGRMRITRPNPHPRNDITLTPEQNSAVEAMLAFERTRSTSTMVLTGAAGTGKTTVLQHYLRETDREVVLTAPTNKAVRVLAEMASNHGLTASCCTIHKLLGLTIRDDAEEKYCGADAIDPDELPVFDVLVVDECSMVGNRTVQTPHGEAPGLFDTLMQRVERWGKQFNRHIKVIFVGDPCQLPPVKEGDLSPTFEAGPAQHLTKVVRQAQDNPIIGLASWIRAKLEDRDPGPRPPLVDDEFTGVCAIQDRRDFEDLIRCAYEERPSDPTENKVLAFRNVTVDRYNDMVRESLFGKNPPRWVKGERYIATQPVIDERSNGRKLICASTDEDAVLTGMSNPAPHPTFSQYRGVVLALSGYDGDFRAMVPHPEDEPRWQQDLRDLATRAQLPPGNARRVPWSAYWQLHDAFAHLRPHYAMTCHRSQGSTYKNVFVDAQDILSHPSGAWEGLRCLYTAVTRASDMLYILE
jgi:ATP-dependent exoDNAse (exonuclease V) alpha subunit